MTPLDAISVELSAPVNADMVIDDLAIDSLEYIQLIRNLETLFGIFIEHKALENVNTLGDLCRVVDDLRQNKGNETYLPS